MSHSDLAVIATPAPTLRQRLQRRCVLLAVIAFSLTALPGCNYFILLGYLIGGPPQIEPVFEAQTKKSFTDRGVRVAVVCFADDELKYQYDNIDHIVAARLTQRLIQNKIEVVDPSLIRVWLEENRDWDSPAEIGAEFNVSFVVYVDIADFSLYEHGSSTLFRGRCEATVQVHEMEADGDGKNIFSQDVISAYPTQVPRSASEVSYDTFKMEYIWKLSEEIGRMFYPYLNGDTIIDAA